MPCSELDEQTGLHSGKYAGDSRTYMPFLLLKTMPMINLIIDVVEYFFQDVILLQIFKIIDHLDQSKLVRMQH
jgi:hypothetical protein